MENRPVARTGKSQNEQATDSGIKPLDALLAVSGLNPRIAGKLHGRKKLIRPAYGHTPSLVKRGDQVQAVFADNRTYRKTGGSLVRTMHINGMTIVGRKAIKQFLKAQREER